MTRKQGWDSFSFSELLAPPWGWKADAALFSTYSADLVAIVHALLALSRFDFDQGLPPSRLHLIKATEGLSGRVRVLVQQGRIAVPKTAPEILRLMDRFINEIPTDERKSSFHPKISLVRYCEVDDPENVFWRLWLGSRNLTRSFNWEAGVVLEGRADSKGQEIGSLPAIGRELARWAKLTCLPAPQLAQELHGLRWEAPDGCEVNDIRLLGPSLSKGFPEMGGDLKRVALMSPFLDQKFVQYIANCGNEKTKRYILSTDAELQEVALGNQQIFQRFGENVYILGAPDFTNEDGAGLEGAEEASTTVEDEETEPGGLHAKLLLVEEGKRRRLWIGSANATSRAWNASNNGGNYEIVAELTVSAATSEALLEFIERREKFTADTNFQSDEDAQQKLEAVRNELNLNWQPKQVFLEQVHFVVAEIAPPIPRELKMEVACLGGNWNTWPHDASRIELGEGEVAPRSKFLQFRISSGELVSLAWVRMVECNPPIDEERDKSLIGRYLDPKTFMAWLRSLLVEAGNEESGDDWDAPRPPFTRKHGAKRLISPEDIPTLEEMLRSWARDPESFRNANQKFVEYFSDLERRTTAEGNEADRKVLVEFREFWSQVAEGLL